jgi:hypothetical protein
MNSKSISSLSLVPFTASVKQTDKTSVIPSPVRVLALSFLSLESLGRASCGNTVWRNLAASHNDVLWRSLSLKSIFPLLRTIDGNTWTKHIDCDKFGLDPTGAPTYQTKAAFKADVVFLRRLFPLVEGNAGITDIILPKRLNLKNFIESIKAPKTDKPVLLRYIWSPLLEAIGDKTLDQTVRFFITNNVLNHSRNKSLSEQILLASATGCTLTGTLATTALLSLTFMETGERLCSDEPGTYMRNADQVGENPLAVGGHSPEGFKILTDRSFNYQVSGAGAQREFAAAK